MTPIPHRQRKIQMTFEVLRNHCVVTTRGFRRGSTRCLFKHTETIYTETWSTLFAIVKDHLTRYRDFADGCTAKE